MIAMLGILLALCPCIFALDPSLDVGQYAHTAWRVRDGFLKGYIEAIAQTLDGYLWVGTEFGLFRFDGVRSVAWQPPAGESLPNSDVSRLLAARDARLWIGTFNGLASWKDGKLTQYPQLTAHRIDSLVQDREGTIWVAGMGFGGRSALCAIHDGSIHCYPEDGSVGLGMLSLHLDSRGNLWVKGATGVWRWKPGPPKFYSLPGEPDNVTAIGEDRDGALLVGRSSGVYRLANEAAGTFSMLAAARQVRATTILRDRNGSLWIGTSSGILHTHQGRTDWFGQSEGLSGDYVSSLFEDREGNVWVATLDGLDRFRDFSVPTMTVGQGLSSNTALSVLAARDGSVWIGTADGVDQWKNGSITTYRKRGAPPLNGSTPGAVRQIIPAKLPDDHIEALGQDDGGRIWVSTQRGAGYFENGRFIPVPGVPGGQVFAIAGDDAGNVWISSEDRGFLHVIHRKVVESVPWAKVGVQYPAKTLLFDPVHGGLWLGLWHSGLALYKNGQVRASWTSADGLGNGTVGGLQLDRDGTLWVATEGGLSRVNNGHVTTLTSRNGLPCDSIAWVREDDVHSFWLYSACGLIHISRQEMDGWVANPGRTVQAVLLDDSDGVRSHAAPRGYSPPVAKSADGRLWFLPLDGVSIVDPRHLAFNKLPPPVHIERIVADGRTYWQNWAADASSPVRLPALARDVSIDYTALSFVAPKKVRFRYRLEGQDPDWREVGNEREVQYSNLPPRHYTFRVIACNNSGVWNELGASIDFSVAPAWYQTNLFRASCWAACLLLLWMAYQMRTRQLRSQQKKLHDVIETIPTVAWTALPDGSVDFVNRHWKENTGLSAEQTVGAGWEAAVHPEDLRRYAEKWHASVASGEPFENEVRFRQPGDGQYRWFLTRAVPLRDAHGHIVKWYGTSTDIEDRKRAEELRAELAHINRVSTIGELGSSLAHELNQPITAAITNARTGLRWLGREPASLQEAREAITRVVKDNTRAAEIIQRLRSFYKKGGPPQRETVDINEVAEEMLVLLHGEATRYSISMRTSLAGELPRTKADRVQLQQVFMNLMLNAIEAMKEIGGELTIKSARTEDSHLQISISDTGPGLPADKAHQIFGAFFTTKPHGTGIGLTITQSIIEAHGGRVWASTNAGRGATFHFTLPAER